MSTKSEKRETRDDGFTGSRETAEVARIVEGNRREVNRRRVGGNRELWKRWGYFGDKDWWREVEAIAMKDLLRLSSQEFSAFLGLISRACAVFRGEAMRL